MSGMPLIQLNGFNHNLELILENLCIYGFIYKVYLILSMIGLKESNLDYAKNLHSSPFILHHYKGDPLARAPAVVSPTAYYNHWR